MLNDGQVVKNIPDRLLWNAFRKGDKNAFEQLYELHYVALYHYGHRFTPDTDVVRDSIQTLFIDLWRRREYLGETNQIRPYLYQSTRRILVKHLDKQRKLHSACHDEPVMQPSREEEMIFLEKSKDKKKKLERAIQALTEKQQEVVRLRFYENLDNQTIANRMGIQVNTLYNLISLALANLRTQLKNYPDLLSFLLLCYISI